MNATDSNFSVEMFKEYKQDIYDRMDILSIGVPTWVFVLFTVIGIVLNFLNIIVFTRPSMKSPLNILLASLEAANVLLYALFFESFLAVYWPSFYLSYVWATMKYVSNGLVVAAASFASWSTVMVSLWRLVAIKWPLESTKFCSKKRTLYGLYLLAFLSLLIFVAFLVITCVKEFTFAVNDYNSSYAKTLYILDANLNIANLNTIFLIASYIILFSVTLPCVLSWLTTTLLLVSLCIYVKKRKQLFPTEEGTSQKSLISKEARITMTLVLIMVLSKVAVFPDTILYVTLLSNPKIESFNSGIRKLAYSRFCPLIVNCSTFFVYVGLSQNFRRTLIGLLPNVKSN